MTVTPFDPVQLVPAGATVAVARFDVADTSLAYKYYTDVRVQIGDFRAEPAPYVYALPWPAPKAFFLAQGWNTTFTHQGEAAHAVDLSMPEGTDVCAAREGTVIATNDGATRGGTTDEFHELAMTNFIYVRHADGTHARYLHLAPGGVLVTAGQAVRRGEVIGKSGNTGFSEAPHLHFEVTAPLDGTRSRSFPFRWLAEPGHPEGVEPVEGRDYTAFE